MTDVLIVLLSSYTNHSGCKDFPGLQHISGIVPPNRRDYSIVFSGLYLRFE